LDERIATGGMGDVWRGTDVVLGRVIAVKVLRTAMLTDPEFAARFYGEARMMAAFRHPGVVEVYDYASADDSGGDEQVAYLVMAYVEGEPLSNRVKQGPISVQETMSIVAQAAEALHAAHQNGTVHRDVKPGNLIVKPTGAVILVDFGVARSAQVTSVTGLNAIVGTALYMAPEQVAKGNVTPATDIYALGAVAYHCIAGRPPFDGDNALQVALRHLEDEPDPLPEHVPPAVRELIARAMAKQPADRFASAAEFAEAALAAGGVAAGGDAMDWKKLTGTSMVAPLSPAAPTRGVPLPRDLPFAPAPVRKGPPRSQTALMLAVVAMIVLAVGLTVAIALRSGSKGNDPVPSSVSTPSAGSTGGAQVEESFSTTQATSTPHSNNRPNGTNVQPSLSVLPSLSASSSSAPASSATPSTKPTTTPPTTAPTTAPTTDTPTDTPTTTPTTTPDGAGPGVGPGAGN
jgi:serine/threonine-protein kinase